MILTDTSIIEAREYRRLLIEPYDQNQLQPSSYDVRLDKFFQIFDIDPRKNFTRTFDPTIDKPVMREITVPPDTGIVIDPGGFMLGQTVERIGLPTGNPNARFVWEKENDIVGRIEGKSSLGRIGLLIHATAGYIDPGFEGNITLELSNVSPQAIKLTPGMLIAQVSFSTMTGCVAKPYAGKYNGQSRPEASRFNQNELKKL